MLSNFNITPTVAVKDMTVAKEFYENVLGLKSDNESMGGLRYKCGSSYLFVYESKENAGTNKATCAGWQANDLDAVVSELKSKGLTFEQYDMPGVTRDGDIHSMGDQFRAVWFKDPDGNIFAVDEISTG